MTTTSDTVGWSGLSTLRFSRETTDDVASEVCEAGLTDYLRKGTASEQ